jgi:hypothetical protein
MAPSNSSIEHPSQTLIVVAILLVGAHICGADLIVNNPTNLDDKIVSTIVSYTGTRVRPPR